MIGASWRNVSGALMGAAMLSLAACSGDSQSQAPAPQAQSTPATPAASSSPADYEGAHDLATCDVITGWARDRNHPDQAVKVEIRDGDTKLATVNADQRRNDLVAAGWGSGLYGFGWPVPTSLKDGRPHTIRVTFSGTETPLLNTSKSLTCGS